MLRNELIEIKYNLLEKPSKKEEIISNLRDTVKKEDLANQELKLRLDVATKKVESFNRTLE